MFAVSTYASVSLLFWYMGMIPDLATLRDRATNTPRKIAYGIFADGLDGLSRHWHRYERAYLLLAALATPLVLSVHSVVSFDFAVSQLPGWHTTIFPPYFVAGAIFSGFAMVLTLMVPARQFFGLKHIITMNHIDVMCRILMATGMLVGYAYAIEFFIAWYGGVQYESFAFVNRAFGNYWWAYWIMVSCNVIFPQVFWSKKMRRNLWVVMLVSITTNIGMWFERFVITVTSLSRDFVPSSWGYFSPTWVDMCMFLGSFGLFFTLFLLFLRFLPTVAIAEVKTVMPQAHAHGHDHEGQSSGDFSGDHSSSDSAGSGGSVAPALQAGRLIQERSMSDQNQNSSEIHGVVGYYSDVDGIMNASRKSPGCGLQEVGCLHALPGPRHRRGDGHQADDPALDRAEHGPDRPLCRPLPAVVHERV